MVTVIPADDTVREPMARVCYGDDLDLGGVGDAERSNGAELAGFDGNERLGRCLDEGPFSGNFAVGSVVAPAMGSNEQTPTIDMSRWWSRIASTAVAPVVAIH